MLADRAKTLHGDAGAFQIEPDELRAISIADASPKPVAPIWSSGIPPTALGQADGAPGFVLDPAHAELVGSHVGTGDVVGQVAD